MYRGNHRAQFFGTTGTKSLFFYFFFKELVKGSRLEKQLREGESASWGKGKTRERKEGILFKADCDGVRLQTHFCPSLE